MGTLRDFKTGLYLIVAIIVNLIAVQHAQAFRTRLLSSDNNEVSLSAYKAIKGSSKGSIITSPFSTRVMMAMLMAGARGNTRSQLMKAMKFPADEEELFETYRAYINQLNAPSPVQTDIANRVFLQDGYPIQENFQNILKHHFQAPMQQISFKNPKKAADEINGFVARKTGHRIQRVVESNDLSNQTRMVMVNTLFFKGAWENPFPTSNTRRMPFFLDNGGRTATVNMMQVEAYFKAKDFKELDCTGVVIPYQKTTSKDDTYQMVLLVPNKKNGLEQLERSLNDFSDIESLYDAPSRNIELRLPRFNVETTMDLKEPLQKMGITDVFDENKADLGGIPNIPRNKQGKGHTESQMFLNKIIQKAFLTVDEAGSEAGAATLSVVFVPLSIRPPVEEVITVDRPFFGFIRDARTNTIIFTFRSKVE